MSDIEDRAALPVLDGAGGEFIPISYLNALEYCPRRFYLEYVLGEMAVNAHVLEGRTRHEAVDDTGIHRESEVVVHRRTSLFSNELRITGLADLIEERAGTDGRPRYLPVEYKKGPRGQRQADQVQLCAEATCIEERTGTGVPEGAIFYFGSRRRVRVEFTPALRERTRCGIERAHRAGRRVTARTRRPAAKMPRM